MKVKRLTDRDGNVFTPQVSADSTYLSGSKKTLTTKLSEIDTELGKKLNKLTYEYNSSLSFGSSGYLCIGKFPCYDSNITVYIDSTTNTTYHGVLVIATQSINTTGGGVLVAKTYGDSDNALTSALYIDYNSGSNAIGVYFKPLPWSKNIVHIKCQALAGTPTEVMTNISSIPSTATRKPVNTFTSTVSSAPYFKDASVSGQKVTFTKGDGTTKEITTQDQNVTKTVSTSNGSYPVLANSTSGATSTSTGTSVFATDIFVNPSQKTLVSPNLSAKYINLSGTVPTYKLGDTGPGGGKVFYDAGKTMTSKYLDADGNEVSYNWRYLEVSDRLTAKMPDGSTATTHPWGVNWNSTSGWLWSASAVPGLLAEIGTGRYNTTKAVNQLGTDLNSHYYASPMQDSYVTGPGNYAPCLCYNYRGGGFSDWYLPSIQELVKIYTNAKLPGFINENSWCWSSSVYSSTNCWHLNFNVPYVAGNVRYGRGYVRAVRGFLP